MTHILPILFMGMMRGNSATAEGLGDGAIDRAVVRDRADVPTEFTPTLTPTPDRQTSTPPTESHGGRRMTGAQLRVQREFLGFSRAQLSEVLGITAGVIADWEDGRDPTPYHLPERIATIVTFTENYLQALVAEHSSAGVVMTYRTDAGYTKHHPNPVYTASWHRRVCGRLLERNPALTIDFYDSAK